MRILVLVLSHDAPPYDRLQCAQEKTWDSVDTKGVSTIYFLGGTSVQTALQSMRAYLCSSAAGVADFVFRTNSSSYVDKDALHRFASTMPTRRCYAGIDAGGFVSGSGILLSKDCVELLVRDLPQGPVACADDEIIGAVMDDAGVRITPGGRRFDYFQRAFEREFFRQDAALDEAEIRDAYHIRCKSDTDDRRKDIAAMWHVHAIKGLASVK